MVTATPSAAAVQHQCCKSEETIGYTFDRIDQFAGRRRYWRPEAFGTALERPNRVCGRRQFHCEPPVRYLRRELNSLWTVMPVRARHVCARVPGRYCPPPIPK